VFNSVTVAEVRRRMLEKLAASGLDAKDAKVLGYEPFGQSPAELWPSGPGFRIPYYDLARKPTPFYRFRYLPSIWTRKNGHSKPDDEADSFKERRYSQPELPSEPHFPLIVPWKKFLAAPRDENWKLFITEGELKATCAAKLGFPTIGLGGAWNFRSRTEFFIKGLKDVDWTDANVYIVYDSDSSTNYQVMQGANTLARELLQRKAKIYIVLLPALAEGKKTGLDDYLVAEGRKRFEELVGETKPWEPSRALHELNEEVVFVKNPGLVISVKDMQRMAPDKFTGSIYRNRIWEVTLEDKDGNPRKKKLNAAAEWLAWPARGEVVKTTYAPGRERILEDTKELNTWLGWGTVPKKGSVELWKKLLNYTFQGALSAERRWFEQWLAYPLQYPGTKLFTAVILHSREQGTGKTLLAYTMKQIYGRANFSEIAETDLHGAFNNWAAEKQMVFGEEISGGDKRTTADRLKALITHDMLRLNPKYIPEYDVPDCINYIFASQHSHSFYLEDKDRRYFVHELKNPPLLKLDAAFVKEYDRWYQSPEGAGALFHYFLHNVDTEDFNPKAPAMVTDSKKNMIDLGRSDAGAWVAELLADPGGVLYDKSKPVLGSGGIKYAPITYALMTTEELFHEWRKYDTNIGKNALTKPGLSRELRAMGFRQVNQGAPVTINPGVAYRLWAVQDNKALKVTRSELETAPGWRVSEVYRAERGIAKIAYKEKKHGL
jgi:hypothetical protein